MYFIYLNILNVNLFQYLDSLQNKYCNSIPQYKKEVKIFHYSLLSYRKSSRQFNMLVWDGKISSDSPTTPDQMIDIPSLVDMVSN